MKTFVGTRDNALLIQIWTALIAILLLKWLDHPFQSQVVVVKPQLDPLAG